MNSVDLLHPELLPAETLVQILLERRVKIEGVASMAKEQLLEIYVKFCLPRTQRKSRENGRSKVSYQYENVSKEESSKSVDTDFKCGIVNEWNENNVMMECDKFPLVKQKFSDINSIQTGNCSQDNLFILKRKFPCNIENRCNFDSIIKRQRTHTG